VADELIVELDAQCSAAAGVRGWGRYYMDPLAYYALIGLLPRVNGALGWKTQNPDEWLGDFGYSGDVKELANAMSSLLVADRNDDSVAYDYRHDPGAFGWIRTRDGNSQNPDAASKLRDVHKRIRDVLDILRLDDKGNPIPEAKMKRGRKRKGRKHPRHGKGRGACPCCALREIRKDPVRERWMRLLRPKARKKARRR
jgi:hypothetical protein